MKKWEIHARREQILLLLSRGYSQYEVQKELDISKMTMAKDMQYINETTKKGLFGLAKETLSTMFYNCTQGINEVQKECWNIYRNESNQYWIRIAALKLLRRCNETKFNMFIQVPALMETDRLKEEIKYIKDKTFDEKGNFVRPLTDEELDNLGRP